MHFFQPHSGLHRNVCLVSVPDLGSYKYTLLDFCVTYIWELIPHIFESMAGFIHTFHKVFREAQLCVQRGQINFLRKNKRRTDDIFLPWRQWCSFRAQFVYIAILLVPLPQEIAVFCVTELHSSNIATILRSLHNFHLNSSDLIFPNGSFMLS